MIKQRAAGQRRRISETSLDRFVEADVLRWGACMSRQNAGNGRTLLMFRRRPEKRELAHGSKKSGKTSQRPVFQGAQTSSAVKRSNLWVEPAAACETSGSWPAELTSLLTQVENAEE